MRRVQLNWVTLLSLFLVIGLSGRNAQAGFFDFAHNINGVIQKFDGKIFKYNSRVGQNILEYAEIDSERYYIVNSINDNILSSYVRFNQGVAQVGVGTLAEPIAAIADKYQVWVKGKDPTPNTSLVGALPRSLGHVASGSLKVVGGLTGMVLEASKSPFSVVIFAPLAVCAPLATLSSAVHMTSAALGTHRFIHQGGAPFELHHTEPAHVELAHAEVIQTEGQEGLQHSEAVHQETRDKSLPVAEEIPNNIRYATRVTIAAGAL